MIRMGWWSFRKKGKRRGRSESGRVRNKRRKHRGSSSEDEKHEFSREFHAGDDGGKSGKVIPHILVCGVVIYGNDYTQVPPPTDYKPQSEEWTIDYFWSKRYSRAREKAERRKRRRYKNGHKESSKKKTARKQKSKEGQSICKTEHDSSTHEKRIDSLENKNSEVTIRGSEQICTSRHKLVSNEQDGYRNESSRSNINEKQSLLIDKSNVPSHSGIHAHEPADVTAINITKEIQSTDATNSGSRLVKPSPPPPPNSKSGRSSPHFMERRRITSARKKPVAYPREKNGVMRSSESSFSSSSSESDN